MYTLSSAKGHAYANGFKNPVKVTHADGHQVIADLPPCRTSKKQRVMQKHHGIPTGHCTESKCGRFRWSAGISDICYNTETGQQQGGAWAGPRGWQKWADDEGWITQ